MAITRVQTQVTWAAAASTTLSITSIVVSDAITVDPSCVALSIQLSADNAGTPASGDTVEFRIRWSAGDVLGDTGNDYDTAEHSQFLALLDTYATNTPGEDPARRTYNIPLVSQSFQITAQGAQSNLRNIVVRARVEEQRAA